MSPSLGWSAAKTSESITGMWRVSPPAAAVLPRLAIIPVLPLARRFRGDVKGEIVLVIGPASSEDHDQDVGFAVDALRHLVQSGARPRAAASVVAALTGTRANDLYRALTGREPRR